MFLQLNNFMPSEIAIDLNFTVRVIGTTLCLKSSRFLKLLYENIFISAYCGCGGSGYYLPDNETIQIGPGTVWRRIGRLNRRCPLFMKYRIVISLLSTGLLACCSATAQKSFSLSVNAGVAQPVGKFTETNLTGGGMGLLLVKSVSHHVSLLGEASFMSFVGNQEHGFKYPARTLFPLTAGGRYYLNPASKKDVFYLQVKGGICFDGSQHPFAWEPGIGCLLYPATNRLDISFRYQSNRSREAAYRTDFLSLRVGYVLRFKRSGKTHRK